jgi:hypothetical protein
MRSRNLQVLTDEIRARYPGVVIYGIGDDDHKLRISDHNEDDTAGSKPAQSDPDSVPEHRAIDIMLGPAFSASQAEALVQEMLADPAILARLRYMIYNYRIWSASAGWVEQARTLDPHPDHIHLSGRASNDEDPSPWLKGVSMGRVTLGMANNELVRYLQQKMAYVVQGDARLGEHPLVADGNYGPQTAYWVSVLLLGGYGEYVDGYWFAVLDEMHHNRKVEDARRAHLADAQHGGELPDSATFTIPAQTVTATLS